MKKKMDLMTKAKLIYSGELAVFALVFLVLAILEFTQVIKISERHHTIFNWVTIFGGSWLIADFVWALLDKKRQKRIAMIDKIIHMPLGFYLISFDLFCLITKPSNQLVYQYGIPCALSYLFVCYTFEAIFHFKYPIPGLLEIEKEENQVVSEQEAVILEDNKEEKEGDNNEQK